nr:hypothetical protein CFP56_32238 [Quercus suber]
MALQYIRYLYIDFNGRGRVPGYDHSSSGTFIPPDARGLQYTVQHSMGQDSGGCRSCPLLVVNHRCTSVQSAKGHSGPFDATASLMLQPPPC